jgi:hypothetical protein
MSLLPERLILIHLRVVVVLVVRMKAADRYLSILPTAGN